MSEETTAEVFPLFFRNTRVGKSKVDQASLTLWSEYQRGALSADEFLRSLEHEFLRRVEQFES